MSQYDFRPIAPLSENLEVAGRELRRQIESRGFSRPKLYVRCPLSLFFGDFSSLSAQGFGPTQQFDIKYSEVLFACVRDRKNTHELLAAVVDPTLQNGAKIAALVRGLGIEPILWREGESPAVLLRRYLNANVAPVLLKANQCSR